MMSEEPGDSKFVEKMEGFHDGQVPHREPARRAIVKVQDGGCTGRLHCYVALYSCIGTTD